MKKILSLFVVVLLYLFVFIFDEDKTEYKVKINLPKEKIEVKIQKKDKALNVIKHQQNKAFLYPSVFEKGNIVLYPNNPNEFRYPSFEPKAKACRVLINKINNAKKSIDFAVYGIDSQDELIFALNNAKKRGVIVQGVSDSNEIGEVAYKDVLKLKNIPITLDNSRYIMHNKFFIIDDIYLLTGTMNMTNTGCGGYNGNLMVSVENKTIINAYKQEFEQMFKGIFKKNKKDFSTPLVQLNNDVEIKASFSPSGDIYEKIMAPSIKNAKKNIKLSIFVLTRSDLKKDLIDAKKRGVDVKVIMDSLSAKNYKNHLEELRQNGIKVKVENWGGKNHEKTISIDDEILITGSANFSYNAVLRNDENILFIKNREITKFYNGFFETLYSSIDDKYLKISPLAESIESKGSCFDKIDNDFDGKIDFLDSGCKIKQ